MAPVDKALWQKIVEQVVSTGGNLIRPLCRNEERRVHPLDVRSPVRTPLRMSRLERRREIPRVHMDRLPRYRSATCVIRMQVRQDKAIDRIARNPLLLQDAREGCGTLRSRIDQRPPRGPVDDQDASDEFHLRARPGLRDKAKPRDDDGAEGEGSQLHIHSRETGHCRSEGPVPCGKTIPRRRDRRRLHAAK